MINDKYVVIIMSLWWNGVNSSTTIFFITFLGASEKRILIRMLSAFRIEYYYKYFVFWDNIAPQGAFRYGSFRLPLQYAVRSSPWLSATHQPSAGQRRPHEWYSTQLNGTGTNQTKVRLVPDLWFWNLQGKPSLLKLNITL